MLGLSASRLAELWDNLRNSYWLVPALMLLGSVGLALGMAYVDWILPRPSGGLAGWAAALQADAARSILSTLAGSMATITGIVFSITVVALQLASSQFGPHVLRTFLTDRGSQVSLGALLGTFTYSLLVIIVVRGKSGFVPYASTYAGIAIGLVAVCVLIYFLDHMAKLMRAESVIASLAAEVERTTGQVFPDHLGQGERSEPHLSPTPPAGFAGSARTILAAGNGYIRRIDDTALMELAQEHDLLVRLDVRPGDFVVHGAQLLAAAPPDRVDDAVAAKLRDVALLGTQRTPDQDVDYALQHLAEVAIRALSPGINAPYIAIPAIDQIAAGLCRLAARRLPSPYRRDAGGALRVLVMRPQTLDELARSALGPVASAAATSAIVMGRVIESVLLVADRADSEAERATLQSYAEILVQEGEIGVRSERERALVRGAFERARTHGAAAGRIT